MAVILGADPGLYGALAVYKDNEDVGGGAPIIAGVLDMPRDGDLVDGMEVADWIRRWDIDGAVVERVASRPGQGSSTTGKFLTAFGVLLGAIGGVGIKPTLVTPAKWKGHFCLPGGAKHKKLSIAKAREYWPAQAGFFALQKHNGRAEAALIALWAKDTGVL